MFQVQSGREEISFTKRFGRSKRLKVDGHVRDERTRVSEVCPCPSPKFLDMPVSEVVSVSEVMTLPNPRLSQCPKS